MSQEEYQYQMLLYERMEKRVYFLYDVKEKMTTNITKSILWGVGLLLPFSLLFIKIFEHKLYYIDLLIVSWVLLILTVILVFFSFYFGIHSLDKQVKITMDDYAKEVQFQSTDDNNHHTNYYTKLTNILLISSLFFYILSVISLFVFLSMNLYKG